MKQRKILLISVVLAFLLTIVGVYILLNREPNESDQDDQEYTITEVNTSGLDPILSKIPGINLEAINTSIMGVIVKNVALPAETYDATYRQGSFSQSKFPDGKPLSTFLVDIPEIQRTFLIEVEGNPQTESMTIYTLCPQPGQSAYGDKECIDTP